jgi:hypothetical protein
MQSFRHFLPYSVRFEPIRVRVVHTEVSGEANFCMNGPMDRISGKNCATVADRCQKQDNTTCRHGSQPAVFCQLLDSIAVIGEDKTIGESQRA